MASLRSIEDDSTLTFSDHPRPGHWRTDDQGHIIVDSLRVTADLLNAAIEVAEIPSRPLVKIFLELTTVEALKAHEGNPHTDKEQQKDEGYEHGSLLGSVSQCSQNAAI